MQIENNFTINVPVDEAWPVLLDLERIAPCFPGASIDAVEADTFAGRVKVRLGPVQMTYAGSGRFVERDDRQKRAVIEAAGKDTRGTSTAKAVITTELVDKGDQTEVKVLTDFNVTGKPAQFGRGVMQDVSAKLVTQFSENLTKQLAEERQPAVRRHQPTDAGTLATPPTGPTGPISRAERHETEALDLMQAAGAAVGKRVAVGLIALAGMAFVIWLVARR